MTLIRKFDKKICCNFDAESVERLEGLIFDKSWKHKYSITSDQIYMILVDFTLHYLNAIAYLCRLIFGKLTTNLKP